MNKPKSNNKSSNKMVYANYLRSITEGKQDWRSNSLKASKHNSRKSSVVPYSTPKSKSNYSKSRNKPDRILFDPYDQSRNNHKKTHKKAVTFIPSAICYKDSQKVNQNKSRKQSMDKSKRTRKYSKLSESNKQNNFDYNAPDDNDMVSNKCLIKTAMKPNKINFMSRVSNIYDLVISRVMLPQFVQYFLGQALFIIQKQDKKSNQACQGLVYDWKLDEFKKICEKIYENSEEEDLKLFMGLSLPSISRWSSKLNSTKNTTFAAHQTATNQSRITNNSCGINRIGFFKSLSKKQPENHHDETESINILDKLNTKIDNYLKNYTDKIKSNKFQYGNQNAPHESNLPLQVESKKGRANAILFGNRS